MKLVNRLLLSPISWNYYLCCIKKLLLLLFPILCFFGCDELEEEMEENHTVTICAEIEVTSSISLDINLDTLDQNETFYLIGKNTSALLTPL